jgi:hypothetical protein
VVDEGLDGARLLGRGEFVGGSAAVGLHTQVGVDEVGFDGPGEEAAGELAGGGSAGLPGVEVGQGEPAQGGAAGGEPGQEVDGDGRGLLERRKVPWVTAPGAEFMRRMRCQRTNRSTTSRCSPSRPG